MQGWGTFAQKRTSKGQTDSIYIRYGWLTLKQLSLGTANPAKPRTIRVLLNGKPVKCSPAMAKGKLIPRFASPMTLCAGDKVSVNW